MDQPTIERTLRYLEIVRTLAQREFSARYRGNVFGLLPGVLVPLLFLLTYTFVFSTLIPVKIRPDASRADYGFFLFAGLVGWNLFAEVVGRAPRLFRDQAHFVRKARFPSSALALASCLAAFYQSLLWVGVFAVAHLVFFGEVSTHILLSPLALALLALFAAGAVLVLASLGALLRDLSDLIGPILALTLFLSPVFYPSERIAAALPWLVTLNPMVSLLQLIRATMLDSALPAGEDIGSAILWCIGMLLLGILAHRRVRPLLPDLM